MYEAFYGLNEKPFSLLPDPDFLFMSRQHRLALVMLEYGVTSQAGFTVITGEIGSGKTTLIRRLLQQLRQDNPNLTVGVVNNSQCKDANELLRWILFALDIEGPGQDHVDLFKALTDFVVDEYAAGRRVIIIIDEAQLLGAELLEQVRMISNINADKHLLVQFILVGQPELRALLKRPELEQFAQRVVVDYHLEPLTLQETKAYIQHRLRVVGGRPELFSADSLQLIWRHSRGIPRLINLICDTALVYGYSEQKTTIDAALVQDVLQDRQVGLAPLQVGEPTAAAHSTAVLPADNEPADESPTRESEPTPVPKAIEPVLDDRVMETSSAAISHERQREMEEDMAMDKTGTHDTVGQAQPAVSVGDERTAESDAGTETQAKPPSVPVEPPLRAARLVDYADEQESRHTGARLGWFGYTAILLFLLGLGAVVLTLDTRGWSWLSQFFSTGAVLETPTKVEQQPRHEEFEERVAVVPQQATARAAMLDGAQTDAVTGAPPSNAAPFDETTADAPDLSDTSAGGAAPANAIADISVPAQRPLRTIGEVEINVSEECWLEVTDAQGTILYYSLSYPGEQLQLQGEPPLTLIIGNAPAAEVIFNGAAVDLTPYATGNKVAKLTLDGTVEVLVEEVVADNL